MCVCEWVVCVSGWSVRGGVCVTGWRVRGVCV